MAMRKTFFDMKLSGYGLKYVCPSQLTVNGLYQLGCTNIQKPRLFLKDNQFY